ncbi:menaquinone biosynthesis protein [Natronoglycomyces albus]|uniref:Chorismate dehydratase n=1 Tax=Natronoglycomyces albus TaxID=2811108 RepID=A0A895XMP1_9ACTN|nr:menaquinone biosynthesis protein [Natronoglycomyces albus]
MRRPRVGHIEFLNCLPIYWGLARSGALLDVELHRAPPDQLNHALVQGHLDIGPISLVEYLRHSEELLLLPDLGVTADGPVLSVNLSSKVPLAESGPNPTVALGSTSRTSVLLAKLLLEQRYGLAPVYHEAAPDIDTMIASADMAVLIGDEALKVHFGRGEDLNLSVLDLGAAWREWTALPMVFAVWAVRRDYAAANPGLVKGVLEAFLSSVELSRRELEQVAAHASRWEPFEAVNLVDYFHKLWIGLGERHLSGLREFAAQANRYFDVPPVAEGGPEFFAPT